MLSFLHTLFPKLMRPSSSSQETMSGERIVAGPRFQPIKDPQSAPWSLDISSSDVSKLLRGFQPEEMEQRWTCETDGPDSQGEIVVHFCRSWTGDEQYRIKAKSETGGDKGAKVVEITWNKGNEYTGEDENQAKKAVVNLCRGLLQCQLEGVPEELMNSGY